MGVIEMITYLGSFYFITNSLCQYLSNCKEISVENMKAYVRV